MRYWLRFHYMLYMPFLSFMDVLLYRRKQSVGNKKAFPEDICIEFQFTFLQRCVFDGVCVCVCVSSESGKVEFIYIFNKQQPIQVVQSLLS